MMVEDLKKVGQLDSKSFIQMVRLGVENLNAHLDEVNDLNVFPVPDGDTGTNMKRTIETGYKVIKDSNEIFLYKVAQDLSKGMLLGARGNSGVILSQIFRGFAKGLAQKKFVTAAGLSGAFNVAVRQAYQAVVKPVEGTILTVLREAVQQAGKNIFVSIYQYLVNLLNQARITLAKTKEILDVLKEANVVDSGGAGLVYILEGFVFYFEGKQPDPNFRHEEYDTNEALKGPEELDLSLFNEYSQLDYGYCTEFILQLSASKVENIEEFNEKEVIDFLEEVGGDSIVCFKQGSIIKTHVHTKDPGNILSHVRKWGEFLTIKVENMALQHNNKLVNDEKKKSREHKDSAIIAVASGEGLVQAFKDLGVDEIVNGQQTMNPSADDFIKAFNEVNADNIIVLPNNSNIILAAEQARELYKEIKPEVRVIVIKTKNIPQGYIATNLLEFIAEDIDAVVEEVENSIGDVSAIEITTATRDTNVSGVQVKQNHYIGILNHNLVVDNQDKINCLIESIDKVENLEFKESVLIILGKDSLLKQDQEKILKRLNKQYPSLKVDFLEGKQDIYSYIVAVC